MFRFSIRDLLLVTLVVALCIGWWLSYTQKCRQLEVVEKQKAAFQRESESIQRLLQQDGYHLKLEGDSVVWTSPRKPLTLRIAVRPK